MEGFFATSTLMQSKPPISRVPKCGACGLYKTCKSPKMEVTGAGKRKILLVGEAPGNTEDLEGKQFVGRTGQLLRRTLRQYGIAMQRDCWLTNALICHPWKIEAYDIHGNRTPGKQNRTPLPKEIEFCRPNLINTIEDLQPEIIVPLGDVAVTSLIGWLWKENPGAISKWVGWQIPYQRLNCWICPTYHPSFIARELEKKSVAPKIWRHHLRQIAKLEGRPWKQQNEYAAAIQLVHDPTDAAKLIEKLSVDCKVAAFDYETNMLKPDWPDARIICASICFDGQRTIAFPWVGPVREAMKEFLCSPIRKIASNLKFEERWSRLHVGVRVRNWWWDTMLGAHIHDNRAEITGLKFQSFVWLGIDSYSDHIKGLLKSKGDDRTNQAIKEIALNDLLTYCGLDSLLEYEVCFHQRKAMGYKDE